MNILYLCDEYPPGRHGGIGTVVQLLGREMARQGHNVIVAGYYDWGYGGEDEFTDNDVKVYRFRRKLASGLFSNNFSIPVRAAYKLLRMSGIFQWDIKKTLPEYGNFLEELIKKHDIDVIEMPDYNDYMRFCNSYVPFPKLSVPVVIKLHGSLTHIAKGNNTNLPGHIWQMEHDLLQQFGTVAAVSKYAADSAKSYFNYDKEIKVLYNGIDTTVLPKKANKIPGRVTFTGALTENKGIYQLMKAWNLVLQQMPDAELHVFGKGPVEKVKKELSADNADKVIFHGHISRGELYQFLAESSIAIFPSYAENFALGPMEAMACETAIIYTKRTSGPELIDDGKDGLLVNPDDIEDIASKIILLLQNDTLRADIAAKAKNKILTQFDITVIGKQHADFYAKVLSGAG